MKPKAQKIAEAAVKAAGGRRIGFRTFSGAKAVKELKAQQAKDAKKGGK